MTAVISHGMVVGFSYHLKNEEGETLDRSDEPMEYLHGYQNIIPGLEKKLEGHKIGDSMNVVVPPVDAYGEYSEELIFHVPKAELPPNTNVEIGMQFQTETEEGVMHLYVQEVGEDEVVLNGNHPLAGMTLHFDVKIASIREATSEEQSHGHTHESQAGSSPTTT